MTGSWDIYSWWFLTMMGGGSKWQWYKYLWWRACYVRLLQVSNIVFSDGFCEFHVWMNGFWFGMRGGYKCKGTWDQDSGRWSNATKVWRGESSNRNVLRSWLWLWLFGFVCDIVFESRQTIHVSKVSAELAI